MLERELQLRSVPACPVHSRLETWLLETWLTLQNERELGQSCHQDLQDRRCRCLTWEEAKKGLVAPRKRGAGMKERLCGTGRGGCGGRTNGTGVQVAL